MNNLKSLTNKFLSVKDQGIWIEVDLCTRPVRFDRRTRGCLPLPPIARTLVVLLEPILASQYKLGHYSDR